MVCGAMCWRPAGQPSAAASASSSTSPCIVCSARTSAFRVEGTPTFLNGGPLQPRLNPNEATYLAPDRGIAPAALARLRRLIGRRTEGGGVSLVMPVPQHQAGSGLIQALRSVCTQWCERWELICVDDASTEPQVAFVLDWFAQTEPRIRVITRPATSVLRVPPISASRRRRCRSSR